MSLFSRMKNKSDDFLTISAFGEMEVSWMPVYYEDATPKDWAGSDQHSMAKMET